jgi:hypothetical protein
MRNKSSPLLVGVSLGFQTGVAGSSAGSCGGGGNLFGEEETCVFGSPPGEAAVVVDAGKGMELWRSHLLLLPAGLLVLLLLLALLMLLAVVVVAVE